MTESSVLGSLVVCISSTVFFMILNKDMDKPSRTQWYFLNLFINLFLYALILVFTK